MKKLLAILFATALVFSLAACSGGGSGSTPAASTPASAAPSSTAPSSAAPADSDPAPADVNVDPMDLVYITNPTGTGYYAIAAGQGALLTTDTPLNTIVTPSTGPEGIVASMKSGEAQLGVNCPNHFLTYWDDTDAGAYGLENLRSIQNGNTLCFSFVVNADSGITSVADLAGKRVTFDGLSDTHIAMSEAILSAYGIDPQTGVERQKMSFSTSGLTELAEGRTDACIASIAGAKLEELASKITPLVLPIDADKAEIVSETYPALVPAQLFSEVPGGEKGMPIVGMPTALYCMDDMSDDVVYVITKTFVENYDDLALICEELKEWTKDRAVSEDIRFPYHDGAIKYYKEAGLWTDDMDTWNEAQKAEFAGK